MITEFLTEPEGDEREAMLSLVERDAHNMICAQNDFFDSIKRLLLRCEGDRDTFVRLIESVRLTTEGLIASMNDFYDEAHDISFEQWKRNHAGDIGRTQ